jgi:hypothetical protein
VLRLNYVVNHDFEKIGFTRENVKLQLKRVKKLSILPSIGGAAG